jgi:hypothetical protein
MISISPVVLAASCCARATLFARRPSPDGHVLVGLHSGFNPHGLVVTQPDGSAILQRFALRSAWMGLAWSPAGSGKRLPIRPKVPRKSVRFGGDYRSGPPCFKRISLRSGVTSLRVIRPSGHRTQTSKQGSGSVTTPVAAFWESCPLPPWISDMGPKPLRPRSRWHERDSKGRSSSRSIQGSEEQLWKVQSLNAKRAGGECPGPSIHGLNSDSIEPV